MNFVLTEAQAMIRDAAQGFLVDHSGSAAVRAAMAGETGFDPQVWRRIAGELGWCGIPLPEEYGGLGLGPVELVLVLEQMGRRLLCAPYFSSVCLAATLLLHTGSAAARKRLLPDIIAGSLRATAPLPSSAEGFGAAATAVNARREGERWILQGRYERVPDGATADCLLVLARVQGERLPALFAVPAGTEGLRVVPLQGWDATRRFAEVELAAVSVKADQRIDDPAGMAEGLRRATALARLAIAAEQLGGAQQCLDLTLAYTATRRQFGRVIASFQAVKHRCAEMMVRIEAVRSAVYGAAALFASENEIDGTELECAVARALAADSFFFCAQEAIQLHGGVGVTWECDPQLYFKRAQASSHWLGGADALREQIAQAVLA
jgi:acyl-CoA dehydrogenase